MTDHNIVSCLSHELRTPLAQIIGFSDLLMGTTLSAEQREWVAIQGDAGRGLLAIIEEILDHEALKDQTIGVRADSFMIDPLISECLGVLRAEATTRKTELRVKISDEVPTWMVGDRGHLGQILRQILSNAIRATEAGLVSLYVATAETSDSPPALHFFVSDTGCGIPDDKLDQLFTPFTQVEPTTTRRRGGVGLGLAISRDLCELMGGEIGVRSTVGTGTMVWAVIPLTEFGGVRKPAEPVNLAPDTPHTPRRRRA